MKARCSGCGFSIVPSPSRVVMAPFAATDTGTEQERAGLPSISTVQAPHWASPQPNFGPFSSRSLRRTYRSGVSGATEDTLRVAPFTRNVKSAMISSGQGLLAWAGNESVHLRGGRCQAPNPLIGGAGGRSLRINNQLSAAEQRELAPLFAVGHQSIPDMR